MATIVRQRRDTEANWVALNPIIPDGQLVFDKTNNTFRIGNGILNYLDLPLQSGIPGADGGLQDIVDDTTPQLGGNLDLNGFDIPVSPSVSSALSVKLEASALTPYAPKLNPTLTGVKEVSVAMEANNIDLLAGNLFTKTITGSTTLTITNVPASGTVGYFILSLTNGGAGAVTYPTGTKWSKGTAPTLTASGIDLLRFVTIDGGTRWEASRIQEDSK